MLTVHMNGRAYDYNLGRFLSVDPVIQFPANSQSLNPYSYILNNPMSGTDPTGYCASPVAEGGCTDLTELPVEEVDSLSVSRDGSLIVSTANGESYVVTSHKAQISTTGSHLPQVAAIHTKSNGGDQGPTTTTTADQNSQPKTRKVGEQVASAATLATPAAEFSLELPNEIAVVQTPDSDLDQFGYAAGATLGGTAEIEYRRRLIGNAVRLFDEAVDSGIVQLPGPVDSTIGSISLDPRNIYQDGHPIAGWSRVPLIGSGHIVVTAFGSESLRDAITTVAHEVGHFIPVFNDNEIMLERFGRESADAILKREQ